MSYIKKILKGLRKINTLSAPDRVIKGRNLKMFANKDYSNKLIADYLIRDEPCMIARFGSTEMLALTNYIGVKNNNRNLLDFISGKSLPWWWEDTTIKQMQTYSGFFPADEKNIVKFCELFNKDISNVDILGSWLKEEIYFSQELSKAKRIVLEDLEPFFSTVPWTWALENKKVLIIHPFAETIKSQYRKRNLLFENNLLPKFELYTLKAVQSIAAENTEYNTWFEALDWMKNQIDKVDFDIAIIGCGAYGFPLAAHVKRQGKKAVHLGGATQLLFGIMGKRWEEFIVWPYINLLNEHWTRPSNNERPLNAVNVEGACYW